MSDNNTLQSFHEYYETMQRNRDQVHEARIKQASAENPEYGQLMNQAIQEINALISQENQKVASNSMDKSDAVLSQASRSDLYLLADQMVADHVTTQAYLQKEASDQSSATLEKVANATNSYLDEKGVSIEEILELPKDKIAEAIETMTPEIYRRM